MRNTSYRFLTLLCLLSLGISTLFAVPAYRGWQTITLSDGTEITARLNGDEFYHFWETEDGKIINEQPDGTFVITETDRPNAQQIKSLRMASALYKSQPRKAIGERNLAPKGLVILVQFANVSFNASNDATAFNNMLNQEGYNYNGATGSAVDYFKAQSNNTYTPSFDVFGPVTLPNDRVYYGEQGYSSKTNKTENDLYIADFVIDAVKAANDAGCDFSQYDSDNDGYVDIVYFFYAGKGQAAGGTSETIWPHNWDLNSALYYEQTHGTSGYAYSYYATNLPKYDGKYINNYVCSAELRKDGSRSGIGTLCHEFSHVIGMPDYYDTEYGENDDNGITPGQWSIMDQGSYNNNEMTPPNYSLYDKYYMGWITEPQLLAKDAKKNVTLTTGYSDGYQISGTTTRRAYNYYSDANPVYYIENRQKTGWDAYLPGSGMLVWKVMYNATKWEDNEPNNTTGSPRYTIVPADGKTKNYGAASDLFPTSSVNSYTPYTGCALTEITKSGSNITFKYNGGVIKTTCAYEFVTDHCTAPADGSVALNAPLSITITPATGYSLADASCWTVEMGGVALTYGTDFTYTPSTNTFYIASLTDDVVIMAEAKAVRTVTWSINGATTTSTFPDGAALVLPTDPADCSGTGGKKFVGWTASSSVSGSAPDDLFTTAGTKTVTASITYYAVYAKSGGGGAFDGTTAGDYKIYAQVGTTKYYATGTVSSSKINSTTTASDATEYTFEKVTGGWAIKTGSDYITYTGSSTNLGTSSSAYTWTIVAGTNGTWRINSGTSGRAWIYRAGTTNKFGGYSTGNVTATGTEYFDVEIGGGASYSDYALTCTTITCTLSDISLNTSGATTSFTVGDAFTSEGLVVTASYEEGACSNRTVTPTSVSSPDMSTTGEKTVTVTYTEGEVTKIATYTIDITAAPTYTIRFFDGTTQIGANQEVTSGQSATKPSDPADCTDNGYTFVGWYTSKLADDNTTVTSGWITDFTATKNQDYYAVYSHTVTSGSGTPTPATLEASYSSHEGWTISGTGTGGSGTSTYWILKDGASITSPSITDLSTVTSITFTARTYGGSSYNTVNVTTGSTSVGNATAGSTGMVDKTINVSGLTGSGSFVFSSSTTSSANGPGINNIVINYTTGGGSSTTYYTGTKDCTLPTSVTVTFNANGGEGTMADQTIPYNEATALNANTFSREGYTFQGWATSASGEKVHNDQASVTLTKNTDLYAVWQKNSHNVSYSITPADKATATINSSATTPQSIDYGETVTLEIAPNDAYVVSEVTASGVTLAGTGNSRTFTMPDNDVTISITLAAKPKYTVTWSANGTTTTEEYIEGASIVFPATATGCDGKVFIGWSASEVAETDTKPDLVPSTTTMPAHDVIYYAVFAESSTGSGGNTYTLVEESLTDWSGNYIIVNYSGNNKAMKNTVSSGAFGSKDVSPSDKQITTTDNTIIWIFEEGTGDNAGKYSVKSKDSGKYAAIGSNTTSGSLNDEASYFSITHYDSSHQNDVAAFSGRFFSYYSDGATFRTYSGSSNGVYLYRNSTSYTNYTTSCIGLQVSPSSLDFGTQNINTNTDKTITVTGTELTADASLSISGTDAGMFSVSPSTLSKDGTVIIGSDNVTVTYTPTAEGPHSATLTITSGAFTKTVTLAGTCALVCTTPSLTFGSTSSLEKVLGSGTYTLAATSPDNTLGAAITYSSSNTAKATVDENTGEVTLIQATGSGSPVTITATLVAKNTGVACQNEATASYSLTIYNKVTWLVNDEEYTGGDPTTQTLQGGKITSYPDDPDGSSLCGGKTFIGWTDHAVIDPVDVAPTPLYKKLSDMSSLYINQNTTYYAVFAAAGGGSSTPTLTQMGEGDTFSDGDNIVIVAKDLDIAVYQETVNSSYVQQWSFDSDVSTVAADDKNWLTVTATTGGWYLGDATNGYIYNSGNNLYCGSNQIVWELIDLGEGVFRLLSSDSRYLSYRSDVSTPNWRMGGVSQGTSGVCDLYIYKYSGNSSTYSDYSTVCGTCISAPIPTVSVKSDRATLTWTAVPDATGYEVTCSGGTVSVSGTIATITGLASLTTYTFAIRSQAGDPYSCFPAYHGSFKTADCEDSPVLGVVTVTPTTATIPWTCEAATATIRIYNDAECTDQAGTDYLLCTSPYTVTTLVSNTTYYYKIFAGGICASPVGSFTTEEIKLDITEWQTDAVIVNYNGDANLTLTTYTEETHGDPHANVADDIFFSKYFEAALNVKLLAVFNGTLNTVNLSNYQLGLAQAGAGVDKEQAFSYKKFSEMVKDNGGGLTEDELLLRSNEELILISYTDGDDDEIIACAVQDEENSKFSSYVRIGTPKLQFNGDDVIALLNPDGDMIDLIGAGTKASGLTRQGASFQTCSSSAGTLNGFMDNPGGWYTANGYKANTDNTETAGYGLSSNRCLLIRRNYVKSGYAAVERNQTDFVTLGDYTYMGTDYEGEWKGVQIPGATTTYPYAAINNSCDGFAVVGGYNYNDYYVDYEINGTPTIFEDLKSDPFDGTYVIPVTGLSDKACTYVKIELKDGDDVVIKKDVKVPIMIDGDKYTNDNIFYTNEKDASICRACDVVVFSNSSLTKVPDGTTKDIAEVRDVEVYPGGKLVVPADAGLDEFNFTVNSLNLRRQEDEVSMADIQGDLNVVETDGVHFSLRIDPSNWHYITLPYDCNVSDITFSDGSDAVIGTHYFICEYDGQHRAATQSTSWKDLTSTSVLHKGIGYIVALPGNGIVKRELVFPMANDVLDEEKADKLVEGLHAWGGDDAELRPNHKGWNLIGNPYMMYYNLPTTTTPLAAGTLIHDPDEDPWLGHWVIKDGTGDDAATPLYYIVVPQDNGWSEYKQTTIGGFDMPPFTSYFVQLGGNPDENKGINFVTTNKEDGPSPVIRRAPAEDIVDNHEVWFGVDLINTDGESDETTLLMSDKFTNDYDMMRDLVKMRGTYYTYYTKPVLASRNNEGEMAFNALPDSTAAAGVPLSFFAAADGQYRFTVSAHYPLDEVKEAYIYDNDNADAKWHNLLQEDYVFNTKRGDNTSRFLLAVKVERKQPEITTSIDNLHKGLVLTTINRTLMLSGLTNDADIYVYDVSGKLLDARLHYSSESGIFRTTVNTAGLYFVRVKTPDGQQTLETVVY